MSDNSLLAIIGIVGVIAAMLGYLSAHLRTRIQIDQLREKYVTLNEKFDSERSVSNKKIGNVEKVREGLEQTLSELGEGERNPAVAKPESDKDFVQSLLKPLQVSLQSADQQTKRIAREKDKAAQLINQQMEIMKAPQKLGRGSSKDIAAALGDAEARRHWAVNTLKHLLELSYMTDHYRACGNDEDKSAVSQISPPCQIETPAGSIVAVDINAPLEPYVNVCQAPDASIRTWHTETHARKLRERLREMSSRVYKSQFSAEPELTILLVLNDHYLAAALEVEPTLLQDALNQGVVLATPSDLLNLLQAISFSWRQQTFSKDAEEIRATGVNLYRRFGTFAKLVGQLGTELSGALDSYNAAVTYFESSDAHTSEPLDPQTQETGDTKPSPTSQAQPAQANQKSA